MAYYCNFEFDAILIVKSPYHSDNQLRLTYTSIDTNHIIDGSLTHYNNQWRSLYKHKIWIFYFGFYRSLIMAYSMQKWNTWIDYAKCFRHGIYSFYQNYIIRKICAGSFFIVIPILAVFTLKVVASVFRSCLLQFYVNDL